MSFLVNVLQGIIDILLFRGQFGEIAIGIRSDFLIAVNALVLLNVGGNNLGHCIMMSKNSAEKGAKSVGVVVDVVFHNVGG